jgi:hypothetical protein
MDLDRPVGATRDLDRAAERAAHAVVTDAGAFRAQQRLVGIARAADRLLVARLWSIATGVARGSVPVASDTSEAQEGDHQASHALLVCTILDERTNKPHATNQRLD